MTCQTAPGGGPGHAGLSTGRTRERYLFRVPRQSLPVTARH